MALQLPKGRQVLFAAAPDALDPALAECLAPLETEANFAGARYEEGKKQRRIYGGFLKWGYPQIIHLKSFKLHVPL